VVYEPLGFPWNEVFEPQFTQRFNGLMLRGFRDIGAIWCVSFPSEECLGAILGAAWQGDLIFSHHPIDMRCGDPRGDKGEGFIPIEPETINALLDLGISFYSCHIPLDTHRGLSTSDAIVQAIGGTVTGELLPIGNGFAGRLCRVPSLDLSELVDRATDAVGIPYADIAGIAEKDMIDSVAVIAGGAGDVAYYREADEHGVDCLLAGEITSKIDNEIGRAKQREIENYLPTTTLSAVGLSHAGSEFLVMKDIAHVLEEKFGVPATPVAESWWWR
jgi:putative NIF3 family GTP cyclohydrolase 1 type 2